MVEALIQDLQKRVDALGRLPALVTMESSLVARPAVAMLRS